MALSSCIFEEDIHLEDLQKVLATQLTFLSCLDFLVLEHAVLAFLKYL